MNNLLMLATSRRVHYTVEQDGERALVRATIDICEMHKVTLPAANWITKNVCRRRVTYGKGHGEYPYGFLV